MPPEQVQFVVHTAGPRRANDRPHGNEEVTSMQEQPTGLCECGCGQPAPISDRNHTRFGYVKGQPKRFIAGHQFRSRKPQYTVNPETGCWDWQQSVSAGGYGYFYAAGKPYSPAHRVFYERYVGPIPEGLQIDHLCRNRRCVNPEHLEPVTPAENTRRGVKPKLTREQVAEIKASPLGQRRLAKQYGVHRQTIGNIKRGETWRDVEPATLHPNAASARLLPTESRAA